MRSATDSLCLHTTIGWLIVNFLSMELNLETREREHHLFELSWKITRRIDGVKPWKPRSKVNLPKLLQKLSMVNIFTNPIQDPTKYSTTLTQFCFKNVFVLTSQTEKETMVMPKMFVEDTKSSPPLELSKKHLEKCCK